MPAVKAERLRAVARVAADGGLEADDIRAQEPGAAMAALRRIPGIGPFFSALIVVRASGHADAPVEEPRAMEIAGRLYGLDGPPTPEQWARLNDAGRPFRTWATVLIRAAGPRLDAAEQ